MASQRANINPRGAAKPRAPLDDNISPGAGDDGLDFCLLGLGHS
jgi:hypothetical protein